MRKYEIYQVANEFSTEDFYNYQEALKEYGRQESATLYGIDEQGDVNVIFAK